MGEVRYPFVKQMVKKVLRDSKIVAAPVDLVLILTKHGIEYEELGNLPDSVDAMIVEDGDGQTHAMVNANHHPHRQRFSLAHELGHYFLHKGSSLEDSVSIDNPPSGEEAIINTKSPGEAEADFFAGELLVPLELLKGESNKQIPHLSKVFCVSEQVVSIAVSRHMNALFK